MRGRRKLERPVPTRQHFGVRREAKRHAALDSVTVALPELSVSIAFRADPKRRRRCALTAHSKTWRGFQRFMEWNDSRDGCLDLRAQLARPILEALRPRLAAPLPGCLPQSPTGKAVKYALAEWGALDALPERRPLGDHFCATDR